VEAIALAALLVAAVALHLWRRRPRGRTVECNACGKTLPAARAVILHGSIDQQREGFSTTVAEYHRRCAPKP